MEKEVPLPMHGDRGNRGADIYVKNWFDDRHLAIDLTVRNPTTPGYLAESSRRRLAAPYKGERDKTTYITMGELSIPLISACLNSKRWDSTPLAAIPRRCRLFSHVFLKSFANALGWMYLIHLDYPSDKLFHYASIKL